jgi:quercetin dioxygenase-like cupin family protein
MNTLTPLKRAASLENSRWYMGHLFSWLVNSEETGGRYALLETLIRKGLEPPAHTHTIESETYYILDGVMDFYLDGKHFTTARKGDTVYLPTDVQHEFKLQTETALCTIMVEPGGFEKFFVGFSIPAEAMTLPPPPDGPPSPEMIQHFVNTLATYGIAMPIPAPHE